MRIIGPPSVRLLSDVNDKLQSMVTVPLFIDEMVPALWTAGIDYGIDPVGLIAQSFKETAGGMFTGNVQPRFYNTAGIKVRHPDLFPGITDGDNPLAHAMFPNWRIGARAHVQHVRAYTGWPVNNPIVDPRYELIIGRFSLENWLELGAKWAPSPTYGIEIEGIMYKLGA